MYTNARTGLCSVVVFTTTLNSTATAVVTRTDKKTTSNASQTIFFFKRGYHKDACGIFCYFMRRMTNSMEGEGRKNTKLLTKPAVP